jgi:hypothetical protein
MLLGGQDGCALVCKEEMRNAYRLLVENVDEKTPFTRFNGSWDDISKMYLKKLGCEGVAWICLKLGTSGEFM